MNINYVENSVFEKYQECQRIKIKRQKEQAYNKFKHNIYLITSIILILSLIMIGSVLVATGLFIKNQALLTEISQTTEDYKKQVAFYQETSEKAITDSVDNFVSSLVNNILTTNYHNLTKSKLKEYILYTENYIDNFVALGIDKTHPEYYKQLINQKNEALKALEDGNYLYPYSDEDYILLCNLVQREQGDNKSADDAQCLVACVALNRREYGTLYASSAKDPNNPTLLEVITQKNQYGSGYSYNMNLNGVTEKVQENVRKVLEHEFECPKNVLFQTGIYYPPEEKTMYTKIWNPAPYNSFTYFYYGKTE